MSDALSTEDVRKEIAEHKEHVEPGHANHGRTIPILEAVMLSIVALLAAWSGYSAAKWSSESSLSLSKSSSAETEASVANIQALQIRTLDSVAFDTAVTAYVSNNTRLFGLAIRRMRPGYRPAVLAWIALHPLKNPHAPPDPSYLPQYKIPQEAKAKVLTAQSTAESTKGEAAAGTADKYVRITVFLAAVLFILGISSHFPLKSARYGLIGAASVLLVLSVVQLLGLPGPP